MDKFATVQRIRDAQTIEDAVQVLDDARETAVVEVAALLVAQTVALPGPFKNRALEGVRAAVGAWCRASGVSSDEVMRRLDAAVV